MKGGLFGQDHYVFQNRACARVEPLHRPADVRVFQPAHVQRLGIDTDHLGTSVPQYEVGVVDTVADDGTNLREHALAYGRRNVAPRKTETISPILPAAISCLAAA